MRTTDFSRAPKQGRAAAMVVAEFDAASASLARHNLRSLRRAAARGHVPGYVWHKAFRRSGMPGVIAFFDTVEQATAFRRRVAQAAARTELLVADPHGYSNGVWRAEGNVMAHIPTFTPTSVEAARGASGPPVAPTPQLARSASRSSGAPHRTLHSSRGRSFGRKERRIPTRTHGSANGAPVTDARAMFVGATKYRGPSALLQLSRTWYPMVARMQQLRGYVWHTIYWEPPFTLGTLAFFATRDDLLSFARLPAHRALMQWITRGTRNGTGGYIRLHLTPGDLHAATATGTTADATSATEANTDTEAATATAATTETAPATTAPAAAAEATP